MGLLERLFKYQSNPALSISDYAAIGPVDGGAPWGLADPTKRAIQIPQARRVVTLAAAYTPTIYESGTLFCLNAAITITLPAASASFIGVEYHIAVIADQTCVVAATNAGELIMFNDIAANSFTWSTSSEKVGAACIATCISATSWLIRLLTEETQTTTVTT